LGAGFIHVAGALDGERLGDVVIAAGQIPRKIDAVASCGRGASEYRRTESPIAPVISANTSPPCSPRLEK